MQITGSNSHAPKMRFLKIGFDIGACVGETLNLFKNYDVVYAFEPSLWSYKQLIDNARNFRNVQAYNYAISDVDGKAKFNVHDHFLFSSFLEIDKDGEFTKVLDEINTHQYATFNTILNTPEVITKRLDTFMNENSIDHIDFLKIDTQGYDFKVVKSLGSKLCKVKEIELEVQLKSLYLCAPSKEEILAYMLAHNFRAEEIPENMAVNSYRKGNEQDLKFINIEYHN